MMETKDYLLTIINTSLCLLRDSGIISQSVMKKISSYITEEIDIYEVESSCLYNEDDKVVVKLDYTDFENE